jgi:mono/diheme cytochrome c family protein
MKNFITSLIIIVSIAALAGVGFVYSGMFNVAATNKDSTLLSWVLATTRERSIERLSSNIIAPDDTVLNKPENLLEGFEHYNEMCVVCHGAPGVDPGEAHEGLNPKPPLLAKAKHLKDDPAGELFWVIKNGIRMTAMPAWGPTHSDDKIWAMVAFVRKLPSMSAAEYKSMQQQLVESDHDHDHDDNHNHEHSHDHDEAHLDMHSH